MDTERVAILGCGPAGLLAAHAVLLAGHDPIIFSVKQKSKMPGTQYLHQPIPGLTKDKPDGVVKYIKRGTKQGYATKVYGSPDAPCSWVKFGEGEHEIWHLGKMYDGLWETFETSIRDYQLGPNSVEALLMQYSLVISSIPAPKLCRDVRHDFKSQTIFISENSADFGPLPEGNTIIYDGTDQHHWYRASVIFGKVAVETTHPMADRGWLYGHKPVSTDCDCHRHEYRTRFFRVGRFGKWQKGVLTHNAFWDTVEIIDQTIGRQASALHRM